MAYRKAIGKAVRRGAMVPAVAALFMLASCDSLTDVVDASQIKIVSSLNKQGIYERNKPIPEGVSPNNVKGYYDIIGGAYRYITNEAAQQDRESFPEINAGDDVSFYFEASVFTTAYDPTKIYYTNIESRIDYIRGNNTEFDTDNWPTDPLKIKVGQDPDILKSLQNALPGCRVGDVVRVFLPPNVAYGSKGNGMVDGKSTIAFELTNVEITE